MKSYRITVNGNVYDVTVEETSSGSSTSAMTAPVSGTVNTPVAAPAQNVSKPASSETGKVKVEAPMPGKILAIKTSVGAVVKKGDVLMVLEAMKMENEIPAPEDGTVASIDISEGASVETGAVLASLN